MNKNNKSGLINLAIISTQFQLMNTIEINKAQFNNKKLRLIVLIFNSDHNKQIKKLAKQFNLKIIFSIKFRRLFQYIDLIYKIVKFNLYYKVDNLVIGHITNNIMLFSIKLLKFNKLNLVDDGEILEIKNQKPLINKKYFPINYFSIFNLKPNRFFHFNKNKYEHFRLKSKINIDNKTLFVGTPLIELNLIKPELYFSILEKVLIKEQNIDYILHPRENAEKFKNIKNINFFISNYGVERYLINSKTLPKKIISFYSTSITSLSLILKSSETKIFFIDIRKFLNSKIFKNEEYDYLKSNNNEYLLV